MYTNQLIQLDLADRIKALEESIKRRQTQYATQKGLLEELKNTKRLKDNKLEEELKEYDSRFVAQSRELERAIASSEGKSKLSN